MSLVQKVQDRAMEVMKSYPGCHDHWHVLRVMQNAQKIMKGIDQDFDQEVVELACALHDVGDYKLIGAEDDDYSIAENILKEMGADDALIQNVMEVIKKIGFSQNMEKEELSLEAQIAQDADRLDALGAIGIARCFAYGGKIGKSLWDPEQPKATFESRKDYVIQQHKGSTLHHFDDKIFLLKDLMHTKPAKAIADERHRFTQEYVDRFKTEFYGEK